jgi:hypothetical protein
VKQAVISASALSLLYPQAGIEGYSREQFLEDLVSDAATEIRDCLLNGTVNVQIDFTEAADQPRGPRRPVQKKREHCGAKLVASPARRTASTGRSCRVC